MSAFLCGDSSQPKASRRRRPSPVSQGQGAAAYLQPGRRTRLPPKLRPFVILSLYFFLPLHLHPILLLLFLYNLLLLFFLFFVFLLLNPILFPLPFLLSIPLSPSPKEQTTALYRGRGPSCCARKASRFLRGIFSPRGIGARTKFLWRRRPNARIVLSKVRIYPCHESVIMNTGKKMYMVKTRGRRQNS